MFTEAFHALHITQKGIPTIDQNYVRAMLNASWVPDDDDLIRRLAGQLKQLSLRCPETNRPKIPEPEHWVAAARSQPEDRRAATKRWEKIVIARSARFQRSKNAGRSENFVSGAYSKTSLSKRAGLSSVSGAISGEPDQCIKVWSLCELEVNGWDLAEALRKWLRIDYQTISNLSDRHEGSVAQWLDVVEELPATWRLLVDEVNKEIVGYWHFVPLSTEAYETAKRGKLYGGDVTIDKVPFLLLPGHYKIYFVGFSLVRKHKTLQNFRLLWDALLEVWEEFAEKDIFFDEVCANAYTDEGLSLCQTVGMQRICAHEDRGEIFCVRLMPLPALNILTSYPQLVQLYSAAANSSQKTG